VERKQIKYKTGFSTGALLLKESEPVILNIKDSKSFISGREEVDPEIIPVNSEASRKRYAREVKKRFQTLKNPAFIDFFISGDKHDKNLILFYALCKTYSLIADFMLDTVLSKWYNMDLEVKAYDFQLFIYKKMEGHPELEKISLNQIRKISTVPIRAMKELGMLYEQKLQKMEYNPAILALIVKNNDKWFLEALLLNESEREEIIR
jgi:hypothetical protein